MNQDLNLGLQSSATRVSVADRNTVYHQTSIATDFINRKLSSLFLLLLLALCFTIPGRAGPSHDQQIKLSQEQIQGLGIKLGKPLPATQVPVLNAPAKVVIPPENDYLVTAAQSGLITHMTAAIGDKVSRGAQLALLNSPELLSLQRQYLKAMSELQLGTLHYQRDKKLFEDGIIAERRWQETLSQYQAFLSEASEHRQLLEMAGMSAAEIDRLKSTHRLSSQLTVRAPITGIVMERKVSAGARVDVLAPLYRIANLDELWLEINIPQERINDVRIGDRVLIDADNGKGAKANQESPQPTAITATIRLLGQGVNPENQTVLARAVIDGRQTGVRAGQRSNIRIIQSTGEPAYALPNTAVAQHEGQSYIFVRNRDGFQATLVTVVGKQGSETIITGPLTGSETIAVQGAVALKANWLGLGSDD